MLYYVYNKWHIFVIVAVKSLRFVSWKFNYSRGTHVCNLRSKDNDCSVGRPVEKTQFLALEWRKMRKINGPWERWVNFDRDLALSLRCIVVIFCQRQFGNCPSRYRAPIMVRDIHTCFCNDDLRQRLVNNNKVKRKMIKTNKTADALVRLMRAELQNVTLTG